MFFCIIFFQRLYSIAIGGTFGGSIIVILLTYGIIRITKRFKFSLRVRRGICDCYRPVHLEDIELGGFNHTTETVVDDLNEETEIKAVDQHPTHDEAGDTDSPQPTDAEDTTSARRVTRLQTGNIEALTYTA